MKTISRILAISIIGIAAAAFAPMVFADTVNSDNFVPTLGPTTTEDVTIIPNTGGDNSAEASSTLIPNNGGTNDAEGGTTLVPNGSGSNDDEIGTTTTATTTATTTDPTPLPPEISSTSGNGISLSGGNIPNSFSTSTTATTTASTTSPLALNSCPLITSFMQINANNNAGDVTRLQTFLKNIENLNVEITGVYDADTVAAVKAFQAKYLADTMGPWKSATPSGSVFITTKKKINEIACDSTIILTPEEISIINSHNQGSTVTGSTTNSTVVGSTTTPVVGPTVGENSSTSTANTASVINAPVLQRVWNFFKGLF